MKSFAVKLLTLIFIMNALFTINVFAGTPYTTMPLSKAAEFEAFVEEGEMYVKITDTVTNIAQSISITKGPIREGNTFSVQMCLGTYEYFYGTTAKVDSIIKLGNLENGNYKFVIKYEEEMLPESDKEVITHEFEFSVPVEVKEKEIKVSIDNVFLSLENPPVIINDRVLIPLSSVFEKLGCNVEWDASDRKRAYIKKDGIDIMLTVGSNVAIRNADFVIMDVTPEIIEDRIYVPIRFVCESIGKRVEWNSFNREVQIYDNKVPGTLIKAVRNYERQNLNSFSLYEDKIYFIGNDTKLYKMNTDFSEVELINNDNYSSIYVYNGFIYSKSTLNGTHYSNGVQYSHKFNIENLDGSDKRELKQEEIQNNEVIEDWANHLRERTNLYGAMGSDFKIEYPLTYPIKIDENWYTDGYIKKNISTNEVENIYDVYINSILGVYGEWIYFSSSRELNTRNNLYRIKTDGTNLNKISEGTIDDVIVKDGWIYYIDHIFNEVRLFKVKEDGTQRKKIYIINPSKFLSAKKHFVAVWDEWIYYRDYNKIYKTKIDGSETKIFLIEAIEK